MTMKKACGVLSLFCSMGFMALFWLEGASLGGADTSPSFENDIRPIFEQQCFFCHSSQTQKSGLVLETLESILQGGSLNGPAVVAGRSSESPLLLYLRGEKKPAMPFGMAPLPPDQIALITRWIDQLKAPAQGEGKNSKGKEYPWPFTKLKSSPIIPAVKQKEWVKNPIDAFILAKLEEKAMQPAPPASQRALLRRLYFDLIGVPPTPEEMEQFLKDPAPGAYDKQIEKLLADPRYGERWGRHWLDVVRYAESVSGSQDLPLAHIWRYRDYVIRAFNQDRPYDRFIREQLAGDAFGIYGVEGKLGTGFLRLGVQVDTEVRHNLLIDSVNTTGSAFLGVTLGCARCHDHKYDPIPTRDYYRIEAFFAPISLLTVPVPFTQYELPKEERSRKEKALHGLLSQRKEWGDKIWNEFKKRLEMTRFLAAPQDVKDMAVPITDSGYPSDLEKAMDEGLLFTKEERALYRLIGRQRGSTPYHPDLYKPMAHSVTELEEGGRDYPFGPTTYVLKLGNRQQRGEAVEPGFLSAVTGHSDPVSLEGVTGSRRKVLANWIASPENPLTARVMVNRIWQHHFGQGLVSTPSDFGRNGGKTVHPELIDWLAGQFIEKGWSVKAMHRLMLQSNLYRQAMRNPHYEEYEKIDAENRYLWQMRPIRLEGEAIRDSILAVSGQLNPAMGGPSFLPDVDDELQKRAYSWWEPSPKEERNRRSIYMLQKRSVTLPLLSIFDGANLNESCEARSVTTVTPQVFALFNSQFVHEQSREMAHRILREVGNDSEKQVERAFQLGLQRKPTTREKAQGVAFLTQGELSPGNELTLLAKSAATGSAASEVRPAMEKAFGRKKSLAYLCLAIFNLNEFIFPE